MRKPWLGLLVALTAASAGFIWGRRVRDEARRRAAAALAVVPAPAQSAPPIDSLPPAGLPSDQRQGDSTPQGLE